MSTFVERVRPLRRARRTPAALARRLAPPPMPDSYSLGTGGLWAAVAGFVLGMAAMIIIGGLGSWGPGMAVGMGFGVMAGLIGMWIGTRQWDAYWDAVARAEAKRGG